jgi:hypothetical protein
MYHGGRASPKCRSCCETTAQSNVEQARKGKFDGRKPASTTLRKAKKKGVCEARRDEELGFNVNDVREGLRLCKGSPPRHKFRLWQSEMPDCHVIAIGKDDYSTRYEYARRTVYSRRKRTLVCN